MKTTKLILPLFVLGCRLAPIDATMDPPTNEATAPSAQQTSALPEVMAQRDVSGEQVVIRIRCPQDSSASCEEAAQVALNEVQRLIDMSSIWSTDGDVSRLNLAAGKDPVEISPDAHRMLTSAQVVSAASGGAFDVTIGALSGLWGIETASLPSEEILAERLVLVDWKQLKLDSSKASLQTEGMSVVLDGLVQGDAADSALGLIPMEWDALVNVDGDLAARGEWQVDIPIHKEHGGGSVTLWVRDTVLVASGVHGSGALSGAIDPRTGTPSPGGLWAVAAHKQGAIADALATTLLVTGPDSPAVDQLGAWGLLMTEQGWVEVGGRTASVQSWSVQELTP